MADPTVRYVAIDAQGRRVRGSLAARDEDAAFERLRGQGLSPVRLWRGRPAAVAAVKPGQLGSRESADVLSSLAELLRAGADIRTALSILGSQFERETVREICRALATDIASGESLERAFGRAFPRHGFVAPMVAAGEASGDLPGSLHRAAEALYSRLKLIDQLVSVLAYPAFVALSSVVALAVILLFIVPAIAPLAQDAGATPPLALRMLIRASDLLRGHAPLLLGLAAAAVVAGGAALWMGLLAEPLERLMFDGPARRSVAALTYGSFAISLGGMLAGGAPMNDALRLAVRSVTAGLARRRLEALVPAVREGRPLSDALAEVRGFPPALARLAAIGEASNAMGRLLERGGRMEEEAAMRRIEQFGRIAGPALIIGLGILLGVLMGGLLSGVSNVGEAALG